MKSGFKAGFSQLLNDLQDPQLVARFQNMCGVRGALVKSEAGVVRSEAGLVKNEAGLVKKEAGVVKSEAGVNGGSGGEGVRLRAGLEGTAGEVTKRDRWNNNGVPNGRVLSAAGESVKAKPLRRNSLTGDAGHEFHIENRLLYYLFTCGTELGNELFYISFFPFLTWNVDPVVARRLIVVWVWVMYLGQCTKDVFRWPRPASPPVVKVEVFYNSEYSMPSTHAMSGTAVPLALLLLTHGRWEVRGLGERVVEGVGPFS